MASILSAEGICKSYGGRPVLNGATLHIQPGERIGVVGLNGAGKSTLLRILAGVEEPDAGAITQKNGLTVAYLPQTPDFAPGRTVLEQVFDGLSRDVRDAAEYEAKSMLTRLGVCAFEQDIGTLSGGQRKRVALAAALVRPVDLLLLDEPTNHIDERTVEWLEERLARYPGALMMVTHDRYFLDRVCGRIVEVQGGNLYAHEGNFSVYLERRAAREEMELAGARKRRSILKKELEWMRRGARARSTKQKARIERYEALSQVEGPREAERLQMGSASARLGRKIVELEHVCKGFGDRRLIEDFSYVLLRDDRVGIVGPNGCGKTTLLSMIAGTLAPDSGRIEVGDTVRFGVFAQEYPPVDPDLRVIDYMRSIAEYVQTSEGRLSASQMLEQFLFPPEAQYTQVRRLSGGERRRLYLCSVLMGSPNVLLLDEPTNDLDTDTLAILEDYLDVFAGAAIVVSHDRFFLDRVCARLFAFEDGRLVPYVCSYSEYAAQRRERDRQPAQGRTPQARRERTRELRFSFKEQREYETIDATIAALEAEIASHRPGDRSRGQRLCAPAGRWRKGAGRPTSGTGAGHGALGVPERPGGAHRRAGERERKEARQRRPFVPLTGAPDRANIGICQKRSGGDRLGQARQMPQDLRAAGVRVVRPLLAGRFTGGGDGAGRVRGHPPDRSAGADAGGGRAPDGRCAHDRAVRLRCGAGQDRRCAGQRPQVAVARRTL